MLGLRWCQIPNESQIPNLIRPRQCTFFKRPIRPQTKWCLVNHSVSSSHLGHLKVMPEKESLRFCLSGKIAIFFWSFLLFCLLSSGCSALTAAWTFQRELKNALIRHCIFLQLCCSKGAQLFEISEKSLLSRFCNEITFQWGTQHKLFIAHETWCMLLWLTSKGKFLLTYYSFH